MLSVSQVFMAAPDYKPPSNNSHREGYEPVGEEEGEEGEEGEGGAGTQGDSVGELQLQYYRLRNENTLT